jgi:phage baseplate assembly protein gpV
MEYDREAHVLSATIPGDAVIKVTGNIDAQAGQNISANAGSKISLTAPKIDLNGVIMLNGPVTQGGGSNGGDAQLNGRLHVAETITTDADVVAEVSLNHHTHGCPDGGTGGPK